MVARVGSVHLWLATSADRSRHPTTALMCILRRDDVRMPVLHEREETLFLPEIICTALFHAALGRPVPPPFQRHGTVRIVAGDMSSGTCARQVAKHCSKPTERCEVISRHW